MSAGNHHTRAEWDAIAVGYDRTNTPTQMSIAGEGLRRAGVRAGTRFLDVASGSGALGISAARLGALVVSVDQSPVMLELLRARARKDGFEVETRVMDGHTLALDADSFEVAGSQFGVMLFADMPKALREMARVIEPGGRMLINAYGNPGEIDFLGFFVRAVRSVRPDFDGPPSDPPPIEFQLSDPKRLRNELMAAGLKQVEVETVQEATEFESGRDLWDWTIHSNPLVEKILSGLNITSDERGVIERGLHELVRERAAGKRSAILTNPVHVGVGTKPTD
jgi:ubiquinone/menaquinone biosynthesis C-methylase UbiE